MKTTTSRTIIIYNRNNAGTAVYSWSGNDADGIVWIENLGDLTEKQAKNHFNLQYKCSKNKFEYRDSMSGGLGSYSHSYDDNP